MTRDGWSPQDNDDWIKAGRPDFTPEELERLDRIVSESVEEEVLAFTKLVLYRAHRDLFPQTTRRLAEIEERKRGAEE